MTKAKIITVNIEMTRAGLLRATSDDMLGLHVVADNEDHLRELAKEMLCDLFEAQGQVVSIYEAEQKEPTIPAPWVVVPSANSNATC